ncbi:MAG: putative 4-hydroxybenzoate polyprenyltransferase [Planctomycetaceae bacterium]|nr:putative 4-hydroxybenzoate polyprenyltransferase [Planctomycetaceae bacterium]
MNIISRYLGLIRFSHTLFALPFALLSYAMALKLNFAEGKVPRLFDLFGILLCMVFARSAAMGFNRLADRKLDAENPRTSNRHLPQGLVSAGGVIIFVTICSAGFIASTLLFFPNKIPLYACVPVLLFLFCYSYTKRQTSAAHFWLGASLMLAPIAAWIAVRPRYEPAPLLLGWAVLFWTAGFDLIYATQDADFDKRSGLFSVPGRYGVAAALQLSALCHCVAAALFAVILYVFEPFGWIYGAGLAAAAAVLIAEHIMTAPKRGKPLNLDRINRAFFHLNVCISLILFAAGVLDLIWE